jgi:hypothetical protein
MVEGLINMVQLAEYSLVRETKALGEIRPSGTFQTQIPQELTWDGTRAAVVGTGLLSISAISYYKYHIHFRISDWK